ncbi:PQQ-dependent sugar dehydrogenase [Thermocrispum municipale]|jgi:glucose/arabinose dehydrogenase|uniref:PQQ-dependent sugar dehydrogenase n=1 Tax=Thermocrispum municipale TaxID=37926 RepID=UPI00042389D4|nr:PQQ-dependent sugar dehydrogenase [Thermocrispum municipale]
MKRFRVTAAVLASLSVLLTSCSEDASGNEPPPGAIKGDQRSHSQGKIKVTEVAEGLKVGWDIGFLPSGNVLVPQRPGKLSVISPKKKGQKITDITDPKQTTVTDVKIDLPKPYVKAEGGLLGMVLHPDFEKSRKFTLCQTTATPDGKPNDIRLITWKLSKDEKSATKVKDLITGLPLGPTGQHVGCRPTEGPDGELLIGTGDGWHLNTAQDKNNLGGKVLRVDWDTGKALPDNPWVADGSAKTEEAKRVISYGHRNVQGVAVRPGTKEIWTSEHGTIRDDEINLIQPGKNYGWDPSHGGEKTDQSQYAKFEVEAPMTDKELFPDAVDAKWATGEPTEALCAAIFLEGKQWGELEGKLAVTSLKGSKLFLMTVEGEGTDSKITAVDVPKELDWTYKRLRAARIGPDGALYLTTAGGENDYLLRVEPAK